MAHADADAPTPHAATPHAADTSGELPVDQTAGLPADQPEIFTDLGLVEYLAVGHICIDIVEKRYILGGSASYAALTAHRLGMQVGVLTSADFEPLIIDTLIGRDNMRTPQTGIRVIRVPTQSTTCYVNQYDQSGRTQFLLGRAADLLPVHVPAEWAKAPVVHLAPLAQEIDAGLLDCFPGSMMLITPQGWMRGWDESRKVFPVEWQQAEAALARADATVFSTEDVPIPALREQYIAQAKLAVVTDGRRGCVVYERGKAPYRSHAFKPAREIDPTGCGDVFASSFAVHYHRTGNPRAAADFANATASFVLEKKASTGIPTAEQVADRLKRGKRRGA